MSTTTPVLDQRLLRGTRVHIEAVRRREYVGCEPIDQETSVEIVQIDWLQHPCFLGQNVRFNKLTIRDRVSAKNSWETRSVEFFDLSRSDKLAQAMVVFVLSAVCGSHASIITSAAHGFTAGSLRKLNRISDSRTGKWRELAQKTPECGDRQQSDISADR